MGYSIPLLQYRVNTFVPETLQRTRVSAILEKDLDSVMSCIAFNPYHIPSQRIFIHA